MAVTFLATNVKVSVGAFDEGLRLFAWEQFGEAERRGRLARSCKRFGGTC